MNMQFPQPYCMEQGFEEEQSYFHISEIILEFAAQIDMQAAFKCGYQKFAIHQYDECFPFREEGCCQSVLFCSVVKTTEIFPFDVLGEKTY